MISNTRNLLLAAVIGLLGIVAIWGWARKPAPASANAQPLQINSQPLSEYGQAAPPVTGYAVPANYSRAEDASRSNCGNGADTAYARPAAYMSRNYVRAVRAEPVVESRPESRSDFVERDRRVVDRDRGVRTGAHSGRSKKKSVAIVAGSAAGGAAIGALAGGGQGAAIGAAAGGVSGFVYDRLTHKRH